MNFEDIENPCWDDYEHSEDHEEWVRNEEQDD
jgi:hypothetical protein